MQIFVQIAKQIARRSFGDRVFRDALFFSEEICKTLFLNDEPKDRKATCAEKDHATYDEWPAVPRAAVSASDKIKNCFAEQNFLIPQGNFGF